MALERIWLHIGAEKTGTTSIQGCLRHNRALLRNAGVLFPVAPGDANHTALAAYGMADRKGVEEMRILNGIREIGDLSAFRERLASDLAREVAESGAHTMIFSNEHCSSRLQSLDEVSRLQDLLASLCSDIRVVLYIRDPVSFFESWYSTAIASGNHFEFPKLEPAGILRSADWLAMAQRWAAVFGSAELRVRRMVPAHMRNGDLLTDFFHTVGLPDLAFQREPRRNEALPLKALLFLKQLNPRLPRFVDGRLDRKRGDIVGVLREWPEKDRYRLPVAVADAVWDHYQVSYDRLLKLYFPFETGPLFERSSLPSTPDQPVTLSEDDIYDLVAFLWKNRR